MDATITITIPTELEQRIAGVAAAQGKNLQQVASEALTLIFDPSAELEDARTWRALVGARSGAGRPAKDVLEEIRLMLGIPAGAQRPAR